MAPSSLSETVAAEFRRTLFLGSWAFAFLLTSCCVLAQGATRIRLPVEEGTDLAFSAVPLGNRPSHATVSQIVEDKTGFLWLGTTDGLKRYDGYDFRDFRPDSRNPGGLSGLIVEAVFVDRSGKLWVSSDLALDQYDPATEVFTHYPSNPSILEGPIHDIRQDHEGMIWLSTAHGLNRIDPATATITRYLTGPHDPQFLRSTFEGKDGTFWVASQESVDVFDRQTGKVIQHFPLRDPAAARAGRTANLSVRLLEDYSGVVWVASDRDGLAKVDRRNNTLTYFTLASRADLSPGVRAIHEDQQHALWLGTSGGGLFKLDRDRKKFIRYRNNPSDPDSLSSDRVLALYEGHDGAMWAGTDGGGAVRFPIAPLPFRRYRRQRGSRDGFDVNYVSSVYQDSRGSIWIGGKGIISRIDRKTGQFSSHPIGGARGRLSNTDVLSIVEDGSGKLWFATWGAGLYRLDPRTGNWKAYRHNPKDPSSLSRDSVFALLIDHRGTLWVGTEDGIDAFDPTTERFHLYQVGALSPNRERAIAEDSKGALWIGTLYNGLHRFDPATGQFIVYRHSEAAGSLSNDSVAAICVDHSGAVWAGTANGLNRLDPASGTFTAYYERDGLAGSNVNGVLEDQRGDLWVTTTDNGLSHLNRRSNTFQSFFSSDGVPEDLTFAWKSRTGEMFLGSFAGLTTFFPEEVSENPYVPPVVLTGFELSDMPARIGGDSPLKQSISFTESLILPYKQRIFSFEFASLNYTSPAETRYRYKLEGLEDEWNEVDATKRSVRYTTLSPRDYVFRVQSRSNRGAWSEKGTAVRIRILPPWWGTWWFRAICAAFVLASLSALYQLHLRQLARQFNIRAEERINERTRVARDLHDTLLQSFQGVLLKFHAVTYMLTDRPEAQKSLETVIEQARKAITEGRDAVHGLRSSTVVTNELAPAVSKLAEELAGEHTNANRVDFRVHVEGTPRNLSPIVRDEVYRIACEALRNAFHHACADRIELEIRYDRRQFRLRLRDNGKGFDPKVLGGDGRPGHYGLPGMHERARQVGGKLAVWSEIHSGTEIELTIPAAVAYAKSSAARRPLFFRRGA